MENTDVEDFKSLLLQMISSPEIKNQEDLSEAYESFVQDFSGMRRLKYFEVSPKHKRITCLQTIHNFKQNPIHKAFLQKKNILLSPALWRKLMLTPKKILNEDLSGGLDLDNREINLSQLKVGKVNRRNTFFLRLIKIKIPEQLFKANIENKLNNKLERFLTELDLKSIYKLNKLIDCCEMFSIHEYLLPDGYVDEKSLDTAVLLFRTERVYNVEQEGVAHNNWGLPRYYELIYPRELTNQEIARQLHFHFSEGVGSVYKLDDVSDNRNKNNFSAGYAIPLSNLAKYIKKIYLYDYNSIPEREFYLKNDFGMHFLYLIGGYYLENFLNFIEEYKHVRKRPTDEMVWANKFCDLISQTNTYEITNEKDI